MIEWFKKHILEVLVAGALVWIAGSLFDLSKGQVEMSVILQNQSDKQQEIYERLDVLDSDIKKINNSIVKNGNRLSVLETKIQFLGEIQRGAVGYQNHTPR